MDKTDKRRLGEKVSWIHIGVMVLLSFCLLAGFMVTTVRNSMEQEQLLTLTTVSEKITSSSRAYLDTRWTQLDFITEALQEKQYPTQRELFDDMKKVRMAHRINDGSSRVILIDEAGYYYTADAGKVALWESLASTATERQDGRFLTLAYISELSDAQEQYICFVKNLEQPITTESGEVFPYIILATDESVFDIDLSLGEFGRVSEAFIMADNGRKISVQEGNLALSKSYNLLRALENAEFLLGDSYEQICSKLQENKPGASLIRYQGQEYYVAYHSMGIMDWNTVFILEKGKMVDRITPVIYRLMLVFLVCLLVLTAVIIGAIIKRNQERTDYIRMQSEARTAERVNEAKSSFLSRMSHDIRTPLSGIISWTDVAQKHTEDSATVKECLSNISISSEYLLDLVNEVLDISQIEHGKMKVQSVPVRLDEFLVSAVRLIEARLEGKKLHFQMKTEELQHPHLIADRRILNHILLNVLGNAVKYTDMGGHISLTVSDRLTEDDKVEVHFAIADDGIGMTPEFVKHIWDRFEQEELQDETNEEAVRTRYEGVGLGMAITKELVDLLGGRIWVESKKNVGSTFYITLTFERCEDEEQPEKPEQQEQPEAAEDRHYHILLAEDVAMNRKAMSMVLNSAGITCRGVEDGLQAVEAFKESEPGEYDAILMDIMMPNMNGHVAAQTIRGMERDDAKTIPIFALSANAYPEDQQKSAEAGMNLHLTKPLIMEDVLKALRDWCSDKERGT